MKYINTIMQIKTKAVPKSGCIITRTVGTAQYIVVFIIYPSPLNLPSLSMQSLTYFESVTIMLILHNSPGCNALSMKSSLNQPAIPRVLPAANIMMSSTRFAA